MSKDYFNIILEHFKDSDRIFYQDLFSFLKSLHPDLADKTINWKINQLKNKGYISHLSRSTYSLTKKNEYKPLITPHFKRIFNKVSSNYPLVNLCIWSNNWFNEFMVHQLFRYFIVVETEKDAVSSVFNQLSDSYKNVFFHSDKDVFTRYLNTQDDVIIVKTLISEAPLMKIENVKVPTIEKLLIDCLIESDLLAAQADEIDNIFINTFEKYVINLNKLRRYARRRNKLKELDNKLFTLNLNEF